MVCWLADLPSDDHVRPELQDLLSSVHPAFITSLFLYTPPLPSTTRKNGASPNSSKMGDLRPLVFLDGYEHAYSAFPRLRLLSYTTYRDFPVSKTPRRSPRPVPPFAPASPQSPSLCAESEPRYPWTQACVQVAEAPRRIRPAPRRLKRRFPASQKAPRRPQAHTAYELPQCLFLLAYSTSMWSTPTDAVETIFSRSATSKPPYLLRHQ